MTAFRVESLPLGVGSLVQDALNGGTAAAWYAPVPHGADAWHAAAAQARQRVAGEWRAALGGALHAGGAAGERLARAARHGVVVTTGQQPGLFGGPALVWYKALTALALADAIEAATGIPCAPVFWAATDDADFTEAATTWLASARGAERVALTLSPPEHTPMALAPLGDEILTARAVLERHTGSLPWPPPLGAALDGYHPAATHGEAFVALLSAVLSPLGVSVLDAAHPAVGAAAGELLRTALTHTTRTAAALERRSAAIAAAGYPVPVTAVPGLSVVFAWDERGKRRVASDRAASARDGAARLSPNVLLRPVVESAILPTVAYVAGPGELAYFAQVSALAEALERPVPVAVPRWNGRVIEARHEEHLAALNASLDDLRDPHALATRLAREAIPTDAVRALDGLRRAIADTARALRGDGAVVPAAAVDGAARQLLWRVHRLERRLAAAVKRRDHETQRLIATLQGHYWPQGRPQDRTLNLLPWLARWGPLLIAALQRAAQRHVAPLVGAGGS